jgi:hypothetical protein
MNVIFFGIMIYCCVSLNRPEAFLLAIGEIDDDRTVPRHLPRPFRCEPGFGITSVNYNSNVLLSCGDDPLPPHDGTS